MASAFILLLAPADVPSPCSRKKTTVRIRDCAPSDIPALIDLTVVAFAPLFTEVLPAVRPAVFEHDHGAWQNDYRLEVPSLLAPEEDRFITLAEEHDRVLGYVGWNISGSTNGRLEMVAVQPDSRQRGVARELCEVVLARLKQRGVAVVHVGTGGDAFHAPARALYESLGFDPYPGVDYARAI